MLYLEIISDAQLSLSRLRSGGTRAPFELCLIRLSDPNLTATPDALLARMAQIESRLASGTYFENPPEPEEDAASEPDDVPEPEYADDPEPDIDETPDEIANVPHADESPAIPDDFWETTLNIAAKDLPPHIYHLLASGAQASPVFEVGRLVIYAMGDFVAGCLTPAVTAVLKRAAEQAAGGPVSVSVKLGEPAADLKSSKLDELSRFENIKFE